MRYGMSSPRRRPYYAARSSRAPRVERADQCSCSALRAEPKHGHEVARADFDVGCSDGPMLLYTDNQLFSLWGAAILSEELR